MFMMIPHSRVSFRPINLLFFVFFQGISGGTITLVNRCGYTVWPGILSNAGSGGLGTTGFELGSGGSRSFQVPASWSGRFWARTGCNFDPSTGKGSCLTGDCGSNQVECNGAGATPPATLAEFTVGSGSDDASQRQDFYDVSLVDGYNIPMMVEPSGGSGGTCLSTGCVADLNQRCPAELRVGSGVACKSACEAFGTPEYCCKGAYGSPATCKPSVYSEIFKSACPRSYSYAFDDATSTFTCTAADYTITFCPSLPSQKSASNTSPTGGTSDGNYYDRGSGAQPLTESSSSPVSSWLSDLFSGDSTRTLSPWSWRTFLIVFVGYFLSLQKFYFSEFL